MSRKRGTTTFPRYCDTCCFAASGVCCPTHSAFLCHESVPVLPIEELNHCVGDGDGDGDDEDDDVAEAASWLVLNPPNICGDDDGLGLIFGGKVDVTENGFCDVRSDDAQMRFEMGLGFADSSKPAYGTQSVSISSTDVKSVPESTISEVSISDSNPAICTPLDLSSGPPILMPSYLSYREARVQRYKEKKKTRKFEKKIRYASRKIYAEIRPRIKGRFAKRNNNVEVEMDHVLSSTIITEAG